MLQTFQGPSYATLAQLTADRSWPAGTLAAVWNDGAENGVYRKSGNAGAGNWSRIGDLPMSSFGADVLAQKADTSALTAEATARTNATRDAGVLPLASVAGTANAITAVIDPALTGVTLSALSTIVLVPIADNTGAASLNVGGAGAWPVQRGDGTPVQAGDLRAGVARHYRRVGNAWRMVGDAASQAQARIGATAAQAALGPQATSSVIEGNPRAISVNLSGRWRTDYSLPFHFEVPADIPYAGTNNAGRISYLHGGTGNARWLYKDAAMSGYFFDDLYAGDILICRTIGNNNGLVIGLIRGGRGRLIEDQKLRELHAGSVRSAIQYNATLPVLTGRISSTG